MSTLIISGGNITKELVKKQLEANKYENIIAADGGLLILDNLNILPNYIVGDFDSLKSDVLKKYENNELVSIRKYNPEKDYTDTHIALKLALEISKKQITILGATGTRIDHMISNIHILKESLNKNITCKIVDLNNEIQLINKNTQIKQDERYKYISLIPLTTTVEGLTLKGFKYSLENENMQIGESIGVSNELEKKHGRIELKKGILILIKSKD